MQPPHYAALIDVPSAALLTLSLRIPIIAFLAKTTMDAKPSYSINYPNYLRSFPVAEADPLTFPEWTWNESIRRLEPTSEIADRVRAASALAVKKSYALFEIIEGISTARNSLWSGVLLQESVNSTKRMQAQRYLDDPEDDVLRYPFVLQYADVASLPMRTAAQEILFKAQLDDEILARTEAIRLRYFDLVKTAELNTIDVIVEKFRGEIR